MSNIIEISELELNDYDGLRSSNFGDGIELLMNNNTKKSGVSSNIHLEDVEDLNDELNNLVIETDKLMQETSHTNANTNANANLSSSNANNYNNNNNNNNSNVHYNDLGKSTYNQQPPNGVSTQSWDGFSKINNVSFNPDKVYNDSHTHSHSSKKSEEDLSERLSYFKKLEKLQEKGVKLSREYTKDSSLMEMKTEYDSIMEDKNKSNSIKFQGNFLMTMINGIEYLNNKLDPFDIKLDGWSDQFSENIDDYDDVFGQLYEKYKDRAKIEPEIKLLFQLGGSAMMVHVTNSMLKTSLPGMDDILRQNPDLVKSFQTAAANTISQSNSGFGNFMSNMFQDKPPSPRNVSSNNNNDQFRYSNSRPEMKGPSDISNILSGLKTKNINLSEPSGKNMGDQSTISISDLKEIQGNVIPARSKRRQKSNTNNNSISLDI